MRLLLISLCLGAGEGIAALNPSLAPIWPALSALLLLAILFGYGLGIRAWPYFATALFGAALFFGNCEKQEAMLRERPWMRNVVRRVKAERSTWRSEVKRDLSHRIGLGLESNRTVAALNRAILLGERKAIPFDLKENFVNSGTIHIFAISGLHVMVVAETLALLLSLGFFPHRLAGAVALPLVWLYVYIVGLPPSAVRAALMASAYFLAPVFWRRAASVQAWSLAFLLMHILNPEIITNIGSQLSFSVMLALLITGRTAARLYTGWRLNFAITLAAWAAGVPVAAAAFGRISPGGIFGNLILLSAAAYSVSAATLGLILSFVSETLARHFNNFSALFTSFMSGLSTAISSLPFSSLEVPRWRTLECALWYTAFFLALYLLKLRAGHVNDLSRSLRA